MLRVLDALPDWARDLKLNLGLVLTKQGAPGLSSQQLWAVAYATANASRNVPLTSAIMGMNNIY